MKNKTIRTTLMITLGIVVIAAIGIYLFLYQCHKTLPHAAEEVFIKYMEAFKNGAKEASQYAYFRNDELQHIYEDSGTVLIDYRIENIMRINENLFAITVLVKTNRTSKSYMRVYNFLGRIDGAWQFINGVGNVPDEICTNLNKENYSYN